MFFLTTGLMACQQQFDTAAGTSSAQVITNADATGPKLYVFDCGHIRLASM